MRYALGLELPGPWRRLDPADPLGPGVPAGDPVRELVAALPRPQPDPGCEVLLLAALADPPREGDGPPLFATCTAIRLAAVPDRVPPLERGAVRPQRTTRRSRFVVPGTTQEIEFHHVRYVLAPPDAEASFVLDFATPNLPLLPQVEALFDVVVATAVLYPLSEGSVRGDLQP